MICKECGEKIEGLTRICPHCGERALIDDELDTWSFLRDSYEKQSAGMPPAVVLNEPAAVPQDLAAQLSGLHRMKEYFTEHSSLYQVIEDLDCMVQGIHRPSLGLWTLSGGLAAALVYVPLSPFLPHFVWTYYFILWGGVTTIGYLYTSRRHERRMAEYAVLRRNAENELHDMYNKCSDCFLPLAWTPPPLINRMIAALQSGEARSVQEYMARGIG